MKETIVEPMFTVGIVSYKNYNLIRDAIDSVFIQNYPNIELIVSNDGSDDFDEQNLREYLELKRKDNCNIKIIKINNNEKNVGTCKHLNIVKSMATGSYIMFMAADDAFYDENSISNIVQAFTENPQSLAVCGRCGMYDYKLEFASEVVPVKEVYEKLENLAPEEIYKELTTSMFIPTAATTYNMKAFDILGDFDENIFLIEDWAFFLKMTRNGYKPLYIHKEVSKHRDGGGCHGNSAGVESFNKIFTIDEIKIMEIEIIPYLSSFPKKLQKRLKSRLKFLKSNYTRKFLYNEFNRKEKLFYVIAQFPYLVIELIKRIITEYIGKDRFTINYYCKVALYGAIYTSFDFEQIVGSFLNSIIINLSCVMFLLYAVLVPLHTLYNLVYKIYNKL